MYSLFGRTPSVISFLSLPEICWGDQPSFSFSRTKPRRVWQWRSRYFWWELRFRASAAWWALMEPETPSTWFRFSSAAMLDGLLPSRLAISRIVIPQANHQAIWSRSSAVILWCLFIQTGYWKPSQNSLFKADAYVRAVAG